MNNRHTSLSNRLDSSNQLMQKQLTNNSLLNGRGQVMAAAVSATTKLANVVSLKGTANGNGSAAAAGTVPITPPLTVTIAPLATDDEANDDSCLSAVTIRCQDQSPIRQK